MSLESAKAVFNLSWRSNSPIVGNYAPAAFDGPFYASPAFLVSATDATDVYVAAGTLGVGGSLTINLFSLTDPIFGTVLVPSRAYAIGFLGKGATWSYGPGVASGFAWFLGGTTPTIHGGPGGAFAFADVVPTTIDNGDKNVKITNTDASNTLTYSLAVFVGAP